MCSLLLKFRLSYFSYENSLRQKYLSLVKLFVIHYNNVCINYVTCIYIDFTVILNSHQYGRLKYNFH